MILTFIKHFGAYTPGDCAGLDEPEAQRMLDLGVARCGFPDVPEEVVADSAAAVATTQTEMQPAKQKQPRAKQ